MWRCALPERLDDVAWQAWFHRNLIFAYAWTGDHEQSMHHADLAIELYRAVSDDVGEARCHRNLCMTFERQGDYRQALHHALRSRDLLQGTDDLVRVAYAFNSVGWYQALVGDFTDALVNAASHPVAAEMRKSNQSGHCVGQSRLRAPQPGTAPRSLGVL